MQFVINLGAILLGIAFFALIFFMIRRGRARFSAQGDGPWASTVRKSNLVIRALADRLGLEYIERKRMPPWLGLGYAFGTVDGYPVLVCTRFRTDITGVHHSVVRVGLEALAPGVSPLALRHVVPSSSGEEPDSLFQRCFEAGAPARRACDALLELARGARVLVVENRGFHVVPGDMHRIVRDVDELEGWTRRSVEAARHLGAPAGLPAAPSGGEATAVGAEAMVKQVWAGGSFQPTAAERLDFDDVVWTHQFANAEGDLDRFPVASRLG